MRACPKCGEAMKVAQSITIGGLENKDIAWRCDHDGVTAELRHPVQYVHVKVGDVDEVDGRPRRVVHKEIRGAELVVYHEWLPASPTTPEPEQTAKRGRPVATRGESPTAAKRAAEARRATSAQKPARRGRSRRRGRR